MGTVQEMEVHGDLFWVGFMNYMNLHGLSHLMEILKSIIGVFFHAFEIS